MTDDSSNLPAPAQPARVTRAPHGRLPDDLRRDSTRNRRGRFHLPEAVKRTRFDLAARLLMAQATVEEVAQQMGITKRQTQRMLADPEFNAYADNYRKTVFHAYDKVLTGKVLEMAPLALQVVQKSMRDYAYRDKGNAAVASQNARDVLDRCGVHPPKAETPPGLMPAQEEAIVNLTRRWVGLQATPPPPLPLGTDDPPGSSDAPGPDSPSRPED